MGPGGISREDPNLDIRDVHYSQYGKICPIETPEGMKLFERGDKGENRKVLIELKYIADVGLLGLPNAGKSWLFLLYECKLYGCSTLYFVGFESLSRK